ncbi:MAG TPA: oxidoreductase [Rhodospirillaceae bacterium]|nr:oxidoreductase [Rhodospirillaceae bacterium]
MRVLIYKPAKSATQSRCQCGGRWLIEPILEARREVEPLMGWTSAGDPLSSLRGRLTFSSPQEASTFAKEQGWSFEINMPQERRIHPKSYLDNFET